MLPAATDRWAYAMLVGHMCRPYVRIHEEAPYSNAGTSYVTTISYFTSFRTKLNIARKFYDFLCIYLFYYDSMTMPLQSCEAVCKIHHNWMKLSWSHDSSKNVSQLLVPKIISCSELIRLFSLYLEEYIPFPDHMACTQTHSWVAILKCL